MKKNFLRNLTLATFMLAPMMCAWGQRHAMASGQAITISPATQVFDAVPVGQTGHAKIETIVVQGNSNFYLSNLVILGDFVTTGNNCNGMVTSMTPCSLTLRFAPTRVGLRQGALILPSQPNLIVPLVGVGIGATAQITPAYLNFGQVEIGKSSPAQTITIRNPGNPDAPASSVALQLAGIEAMGDYAIKNGCPPVLAPEGQCQVQVRFQPHTTGSRSGLIVIADNTPRGTQVITPLGEGIGPEITFSTPRLHFDLTSRNSDSPAQQVTLTNTGNAPLDFSSIQTQGDFSQVNTCVGSMPPGLSCQINIIFHPQAAGVRTGQLEIASNAPHPGRLPLEGKGADFSLQLSKAAMKAKKDHSARLSLMLQSLNGFDQSISLNCTGLPQGSSCIFSPPMITLNAGDSVMVKLRIKPPHNHRDRTKGSHMVQISAVSGSLMHARSLELTIK